MTRHHQCIYVATNVHIHTQTNLPQIQQVNWQLNTYDYAQQINLAWYLFCFYLAQQTPVDQGLHIHEVSRSHTTTNQSRQNSSGRVIISLQRPLPGNKQHSRQTSMPPLGFEPAFSAGERPLGPAWYLIVIIIIILKELPWKFKFLWN